ncbi:DNA cytosine methyltransferase [Rhizobium laguerreae]|uniref:DNA (cytosine-5-)-methyltransferase n=1 Tax=Rhizobium laguerreae TaxID=1076926 RepID=A0A7Y2W8X2_9HYPH|nr:DNA cytosine methyltransferase [Rhizobium laguerreae]NNH67804.1 DNA cytosine methyltransferase [Rhizobium laguerreae]
MTKLKVLDLFSGIGGFSLGLERTGGFSTVAFCEIEEFPRRVLAKHWPEVPCYHDVRELTADVLRRDGISVDVICGGFPCQDVSHAGKRGGLEAARSGLWSEYGRLIGEIRPKFVIVENTPGLLSLGMGRVLGDLAARGYDAQWDCIPAKSVGAPHERDRVWIVSYPNEDGLQERVHVAGACGEASAEEQPRRPADGIPASKKLADANARERSLGRQTGRMGRVFKPVPWHGAWPITSEPVLGRGADGIANRLDRVGACGNAVVPQVVTLIGHAILEAERAAA